MNKFSKIAAVAMFGFAAMGVNAASLAPATGTFDVTINLTPVCTVTGGAAVSLDYLSFTGATPATGASSFDIKCTAGVHYTADLTGNKTINGIIFTVSGAPTGTRTGTGGSETVAMTVTAAAGQGGTWCIAPVAGVCTGTETQTLTVTY